MNDNYEDDDDDNDFEYDDDVDDDDDDADDDDEYDGHDDHDDNDNSFDDDDDDYDDDYCPSDIAIARLCLPFDGNNSKLVHQVDKGRYIFSLLRAFD